MEQNTGYKVNCYIVLMKIKLAWTSAMLFVLLVEKKRKHKLDPVGSTVRYEVMKLCTGALRDTNSLYVVVLSQ